MRDPELGHHVVPIVPDEARTFGMEPMFREFGIYSSKGQLYEPVDRENLLYYKESLDGQMLEEGITEAGSMASFIAAGTAHATHGKAMLPFFIFYSMFGMQRVGDLIWAAGDARTRGFLIGATAGRTTLAGEGLQHQDGHSHLTASTVPNLISYDPAYAYEIAEIVREGIQRMHVRNEDVFYYITVGNEPYAHPPMPDDADVRDGIVRGVYHLRAIETAAGAPRVQLLGSGSILNEVVRAAEVLASEFGIASDIWSVTSWTELRREALEIERWNMLHPAETPRVPFVTQSLEGSAGRVVVAASDYMKALPDGVARWIPGELVALGTDGFGRSASRAELRDFFEVDTAHVVVAALHGLARAGTIDSSIVRDAIVRYQIDPERPNPARA